MDDWMGGKMIPTIVSDALWDNRFPEPDPLTELTKEAVDRALRKQYTRCQHSERANFSSSYLIRWIAWSFALLASVLVVLAEGTEWGKLASVLPILSTALLGLEATEPFMARSGWNYTYKNCLERLILELLEGEEPSKIEQKRIALKDEMGKTYPHWRISRSGAAS
jgi:hypothetical protein